MYSFKQYKETKYLSKCHCIKKSLLGEGGIYRYGLLSQIRLFEQCILSNYMNELENGKAI